jgi:protein phosphatase
MIKVELDSISITGRRSTNQDCACAIGDTNGLYAIAVADGMGGTNGGEIASALTCKSVKETIEFYNHTEVINLKSVIDEIFKQAQKLISLKKIEEPEIATLGTTLVCFLLENSRFAWGNIGDSRIYKIEDEKVELLTKDHTLINQTLEENGEVTLDEVENQSHVLIKSIDGSNDQPDIFPVDDEFSVLNGGELFLACSDGAILDKQSKDHSWLVRIANNSGSLREFLSKIIEYAYSMGSSDNITVAAISYGYIFNNQKKPIPTKRVENSEANDYSSTKARGKKKLFRFSFTIASLIFLSSLLLLLNQRYRLSLLPYGIRTEKSSQNPDGSKGIPAEKNNISSDKPGIIKGNSNYFEHIQKGNELLRKNKYSQALEEFELARNIDSNDPQLTNRINQIKERLQIGPALKAMEESEKERKETQKVKKDQVQKKTNAHVVKELYPSKDSKPKLITPKPRGISTLPADSAKNSNPVQQDEVSPGKPDNIKKML